MPGKGGIDSRLFVTFRHLPRSTKILGISASLDSKPSMLKQMEFRHHFLHIGKAVAHGAICT